MYLIVKVPWKKNIVLFLCLTCSKYSTQPLLYLKINRSSHIWLEHLCRVSQVKPVVKNPPANAGNISNMGLIHWSGDPMEEEMTTHSSILAWRIPWTEERGGLQSILKQLSMHACTQYWLVGIKTLAKSFLRAVIFGRHSVIYLENNNVISLSCFWNFQSIMCVSQLEILETRGWFPRVSSFTLKKKPKEQKNKTYCLKECLLSHFSHVWLCATP